MIKCFKNGTQSQILDFTTFYEDLKYSFQRAKNLSQSIRRRLIFFGRDQYHFDVLTMDMIPSMQFNEE